MLSILTGCSRMSRAFWLRVLFGAPAALVVQYLIRAQANLHEDVGRAAAFVGAMGTLYSVLAGFTVISVWQRLSIQVER